LTLTLAVGCSVSPETDQDDDDDDVVGVSQADLSAAGFTTPQYWGAKVLAMYQAKLDASERAVATEQGPAAPFAKKRAVLLITGVTIPAAWFDPIVARLKRDGFEPTVYEPPNLLAGSLYQNSADLAAVVERVKKQSGQEKIDILAECTGGLIARHYVQSLGGEKHVSRLVTFVSPQHGIAKAPLAAAIVRWQATYDLSPGSKFLNEVNSKTMPKEVPFTSIYTCTDEYIRPYQTSIVPNATNIGLGCNGVFVGHFQTFYDPAIYRVMYGALTK
jgi:triacylglycerol esterase/lipase EstA (alpha/beta hydrolase family)